MNATVIFMYDGQKQLRYLVLYGKDVRKYKPLDLFWCGRAGKGGWGGGCRLSRYILFSAGRPSQIKQCIQPYTNMCSCQLSILTFTKMLILTSL